MASRTESSLCLLLAWSFFWAETILRDLSCYNVFVLDTIVSIVSIASARRVSGLCVDRERSDI